MKHYKKSTMNRREFCRDIALLGVATCISPLFMQCSRPTEAVYTSPPPDIEFSTNEEEIARTIAGQHSKLMTLAENPSKELRIGFRAGQIDDALSLRILDGGASNYKHVRIVRESTGEVSNLLWGQENLFPSIKLTDNRGKTLIKDGKTLEFSFRLADSTGSGSRKWLEIGIKVLAIALAIWLGASIARVILAAIAFLAFNAMVIALLILGIGILVGITKWIAELTGWNLNNVAEFFQLTLEELKQFLREIIAVIGG